MMRWVLVACCLVAPVQASEDVLGRAMAAIRRNALLTPKELRCSFLVESDRNGEIVTVDVREKHSKACGGAPQTAPRRFSLQINTRTGAIRWDNTADMEWAPLPKHTR